MIKTVLIFGTGYIIGRLGYSWMQKKNTDDLPDQTTGSSTSTPENENQPQQEPVVESETDTSSQELPLNEPAPNSSEDLVKPASVPPPPPQDLTKIKGLGKVFQQRLADGGIT